jgi:hypothetical protein
LSDRRSLHGDMINSHTRPMKNVIDKYRKASPGAEISSTLAGKPKYIVEAVKAKVEVMRIRHEQGLDLWTGETLDETKVLK